MQVADFYGYKNPNDFAKNALNYNSSEKINRLKGNKNKPSVGILLDISNKFEEINAEWLLTGKGSMIKEKKTIKDQTTTNNRNNLDNCQNILDMIVKLSAENALLKQELKQLKNDSYGSIAAEPEA